MKTKRTQQGFTMIELSIATLIFAVLLAICMAAFVNVGRMFVKGANLSLTQQDARTIMDSITADLQFSQSGPNRVGMNPGGPRNTPRFFCIGHHRYKYIFTNHVDLSIPGNYGLVREDIGTTCDMAAPGTNAVEMLGDNMQLNELYFGPTSAETCDNQHCTFTINLLFYGKDDTVFTSSLHQNPTGNQALNDPDAHCKGYSTGSQFCASTYLTTNVLQTY